MATGIEIAGLALAVFPLVVSGLKAYADGVKTMGDLWRYKFTLKSLIRELKMEKCKFENTCTALLESMVTPPQLTVLMGSLGEALWKDEDLQEKLKDRLGPGGEECFTEAIEALKLALQTLQDDFKLVKGSTSESTDTGALKKHWREISLVLSKKEYKEQLASIAKINSDLAMLTGQCRSNMSANPPLRATTTAKQYGRIRNHSKNLYGVLKENLQATPTCTCTTPHSASLRLEVRDSNTAKKFCGWDTNLRFHVVLLFASNPTMEDSLQCNCREMGLEPLDSEGEPWESKDGGNSRDLGDKRSHPNTASLSPSVEGLDHTLSYPTMSHLGKLKFWERRDGEPRNTVRHIKGPEKKSSSLSSSLHRKNKPMEARPKVSFGVTQENYTSSAVATPNAIPMVTAEKIENLCWTIQQSNGGSSCLGVLVDGGNRQYRVWPLETPFSASELTRVVSLESLLGQPEKLTTKDRLILGVQLASAVMQLHATEWLSENWSKRDIFFIQPTTQGESGVGVDISRITRKPFVRRNLVSAQTIKASKNLILISHDQSLFSLGLILIELWYWQRLEDLQAQTDVIDGAADMTDYVTAKRLLAKIYDDAGEKYSDAARRCIVGLDRRDQKLTTDSFKNEVHMKVVCPLVENLGSFSPSWRQELD